MLSRWSGYCEPLCGTNALANQEAFFLEEHAATTRYQDQDCQTQPDQMTLNRYLWHSSCRPRPLELHAVGLASLSFLVESVAKSSEPYCTVS